jgi:cell division septation protein DedD
MRISALLLGGALLLLPGGAWAQRPLLDEAESLITAGVFPEARGILARWRRENPRAARDDEEMQARYHVLSARVNTDAQHAEDNYLTVAVNYPTTRVAPEALLRLAQGRHARGDSQHAIAYLERIISDYPESELRAMATIWLARVQSGTASKRELCDLLRPVVPGSNPETIQHLKNEQVRACGSAQPVKTAARTPPPRTVRTDTARPPVNPDTARTEPVKTDTAPRQAESAVVAPRSKSPIAIQIGAFRELSRARATKTELERAGFTDIRLVRVPGNTLIRVRIGKFNDRAAASAMLARLGDANISAVLVNDTNSETVVRN